MSVFKNMWKKIIKHSGHTNANFSFEIQQEIKIGIRNLNICPRQSFVELTHSTFTL
jgi:hypothetical protein